MSENKHTPGPWSVEVEADYEGEQPNVYVCSSATQCDLTVVATMGEARSIPLDCKKADASLIAAAPDLLDALRTAKETIRAWHGPNAWEIYDRVSPEMRTINAAIAKAVAWAGVLP